jgi:hypothetical protein
VAGVRPPPRHDGTHERRRASEGGRAFRASGHRDSDIAPSVRGDALVEHYVDRRRRPSRGTGWSQRHREEQAAYCRRFVLPVIADVLVRIYDPSTSSGSSMAP